MALADFIQALQEQDVVYSTPPQPSIRVIPPENQCIKIIPPETLVAETPPPKVIKLKIKPKTPTASNAQPVVQQQPQTVLQQPVQQTVQRPVQQTPQQSILKPVSHEQPKPVLQPVSRPQQSSNPEPVIQQKQDVIPTYTPHIDKPTVQQQPQPVAQQPVQPVQEQPKQLTDEDIFNSTGTEYSKKALWLEYFEKAKTSRKSNPIVDRMKVGRFTITPDNKVLLLPDYDIVGKDPDDVLKDKWF